MPAASDEPTMQDVWREEGCLSGGVVGSGAWVLAIAPGGVINSPHACDNVVEGRRVGMCSTQRDARGQGICSAQEVSLGGYCTAGLHPPTGKECRGTASLCLQRCGWTRAGELILLECGGGPRTAENRVDLAAFCVV